MTEDARFTMIRVGIDYDVPTKLVPDPTICFLCDKPFEAGERLCFVVDVVDRTAERAAVECQLCHSECPA